MPAFLENALAQTLSLDGEWTFSLAGRATQTIPVVIVGASDRIGQGFVNSMVGRQRGSGRCGVASAHKSSLADPFGLARGKVTSQDGG